MSGSGSAAAERGDHAVPEAAAAAVPEAAAAVADEGAPPLGRHDVEVLARTSAYAGYFSIHRYELRHRLYAGGWGHAFMREVFSRGHAVAVVLFDPDQDRLVLIEQFRVGALVAGIERPELDLGPSPWLLEVVAGIIDDGETAEAVALREAEEEAGCRVRELLPIQTILASPGGTSETVTLYLGLCDAPASGGLHGLAHEHEDIRVIVVPPEAVWAWMDAGRIVNGPGLAALMWFRLHQARFRPQPESADAGPP